MKEIPLTRGYIVLVDDEDYANVSRFKWHATPSGRVVYATSATRMVNGKRHKQLLHRIILGITDPKVEVDHEDHNGLNCQRYNMRLATGSQNRGHGRKTTKPTSSKYKGVYWDKHAKQWLGRIMCEGTREYLGLFPSEEAAAKAYDAASKRLFGEFALVNFPTVKAV